jgi:signal transduction histidine kinase
LKASICDLKDDIEFQKTLSRNMSHELKTPIGVIKGYAEGLLYGVADSPEMRIKYLRIIADECDRMDGLVKEILTLSRLSAKDYILHDIRECDAGKIIKSITERFSNAVKTKGIRFVTDWDSDIKIYANHELLDRAVSNLLSNAIQYCDDNKYISLSLVDTGTVVQITAYNTCGGIPAGEMNNIFNAFYKIDKSRSRESGGHGLGLSIVKSIAHLHGGDITVQNKRGGVAFVLSLPKKNV